MGSSGKCINVFNVSAHAYHLPPIESSLARAEVPSQPPTISNELPPQGTASPVVIVGKKTNAGLQVA